MPTTTSSDMISFTVLAEAVQAEFRGMKSIWGSRAVIVRTDMPAMRADGGRIVRGTRVQIPYFNSLGEMEDIVNEGDALTPQLLSMSDEEAIVQQSGKAVELTTFAATFASAGADPYAETARQFRELVERRADAALLTAASTGLPSDYIKDVWSNGSPVNLDWDLIIDAKVLWGDEQGDIELMVVHSKVYGALLKLKDANGRPLLLDPQNGEFPRFAGIPIKVSDKGTVVDPGGGQKLKYKTRIYKRGALVFWMNGMPVPKTDEDILADTQVMAIHVYWVAHRYLRAPGSTRPGVVEIIHNVSP